MRDAAIARVIGSAIAATAVFDAREAFKDDFRCITMDRRNANGGGSPARSRPMTRGAPSDDQLGLMDQLGIQKFFFMGYCIGGPFALKLVERAPDRVVVAVLWLSRRDPTLVEGQ